MVHLNEKIAEFVLGEMTGSEAAGAAEHVRQCPECSRQVQDFTRIHQMLKMSPDADLPRPVLFEVERPATSSPAWLWRWLPPVASAVAASILTAVFLNPAPPPAPQPEYESLVIELQTLRGDLEYYKARQLADRRDAWETTKVIQQLAQKFPSED